MAKESSVEERSRDLKAEKHRLEGFRALVASDKSNSYGMEGADGEYRPWKDLSPEAQLGQIASNAAYYSVPFEAFAQEVRDTVGHLPAATREEAALRVAWRNESELHELAKLLPEHDRVEPYPLIEQLRDTLDYYRGTVAQLSGDAKIGKAFKESIAEAACQKDSIRDTLREQLFARAPEQQPALGGDESHPPAEPTANQPEQHKDRNIKR
jgi:hypothetical protein